MIISMGGGGVKCCVFIGALIELNTHVHFDWVDGFAGCSGGALLAIFLCFGVEPSRLVDMYDRIGLVFDDEISLERTIEQYGVDAGEKAREALRAMLREFHIDPDTRLNAWPARAKRYCVGVFDLTHACTVVWDTGSDDAPDVTITQAVLASCAVPLIFAPVTIQNVQYVDGCVGCVAPILLDAIYFTLLTTHQDRLNGWDDYMMRIATGGNDYYFKLAVENKTKSWVRFQTPNRVGLFQGNAEEVRILVKQGRATMNAHIAANGLGFSLSCQKFTFASHN